MVSKTVVSLTNPVLSVELYKESIKRSRAGITHVLRSTIGSVPVRLLFKVLFALQLRTSYWETDTLV